ncbi:MAG: GGDEF domain-containing protein [Angelakisella sp.]
MHTGIKKWVIFLATISIVVSIVTLGITLEYEHTFPRTHELPSQLTIDGRYRVNGSDLWMTLPKDHSLGLSGNNTVTVEGHFNSDIPENVQIMMRIDNLRVKVFINDEAVYSFGEPHSFPVYARSAGNLWDYFVSPGIKATDTVRLELYNVYTNHVNTSFKSFLDSICFGYESVIIRDVLGGGLLNSFASFFAICIGVLAIGTSVLLRNLGRRVLPTICFACLSICSGIWFFMDFKILHYMIPYPVFNNSLDIISLILTAALLLLYVAVQLHGRWSIVLRITALTQFALILVATVCQFIGIGDYYHFIPVIYIECFASVVLILGGVFYERYRRPNEEINRLVRAATLLCVGALGDIACYYLGIVPYTFGFKVAFFIFVLMQFGQLIKSISEFIAENARVQVLQSMAYRDSLTGLANRAAYLEKVEQLKDQLHLQTQFAILFFDVNNLKQINDLQGHEQGDLLIISAAHIITHIFQGSPVYRIGGDEFIVILEGESYEARRQLLESFTAALAEYNADERHAQKLSIAYGIAARPTGQSIAYEAVFKRSEKAMYRNKTAEKEKASTSPQKI